MTWVLIIVFTSGYGVTAITVDQRTEQQCEASKAKIEEKAEFGIANRAYCITKG